MKHLKFTLLALGLAAMTLPAAQSNETNDIETLRAQLQQMRDNFERVQREQRDQIEALTRKLDQLTGSKAASQPAAAPPKTADQKKLEDQLAAELGGGAAGAPSGSAPPVTGPAWSPSAPLTVARAGGSYMNISFDALIDGGWSQAANPSAQLQLGDHDPIQRGFSLRNGEIAVDGAVDPYFKGFANIVFKLDNHNETSVELEETYFQTTSLPGNLQVKGGQFFANFGRQNSQHPHTWAFVDAPLILTRAFGPDGLRNIGAQVSWLVPTPFYTELFLGVYNPQGGTAFGFDNPGDPVTGTNRFYGRATFDRNLAGPQDLLYTPRLASSFDLTDNQTLVAGVSGAFGPNDTSPHSRTEVYGADLYWKWKSPRSQEGFPFVSWQTEGLYERYGAAADPAAPGGPLPSENLRNYGFYSQVLWGFKPHWVTGLRGDYVTGNAGAFDAQDPFRGDRYRISPVLTWYPTEFSKIRLQYNYDHGQYIGSVQSVWMQMEFLLGAHGAHKF